MPLLQSTLADKLESIFADPPETFEAAGKAWAAAVGEYAADVVPPSSSVSGAQETLAVALAADFAVPLGAPPLMEVAFLAFGATVGLGMAPAFVAVPPAAPVGFVAQFVAPPPATHRAAAEALAAKIHAWMGTGTANTVPPSSPVSWS